ncbi:MAG TPA: nuclear transport factor 2 family protein [Vicinamibacterales bacterium]|jgi:hypothetical protein|nr:nuclear transport factor 2 family protein [Vicinamibacterales bacterium]
MQFLDVAAVAVLLGAAPQGENRIREAMVLDDTAAKLRAELVAIHDKWYRAFDVGDGATMDALEVDDLVLVMPDGSIWAKPGPRAGKQPKRHVQPQRSLGDVTVRQFGDTAILTGMLTSRTPGETDKAGTTVVFVRRGGRWLIASTQWTASAGG